MTARSAKYLGRSFDILNFGHFLYSRRVTPTAVSGWSHRRELFGKCRKYYISSSSDAYLESAANSIGVYCIENSVFEKNTRFEIFSPSGRGAWEKKRQETAGIRSPLAILKNGNDVSFTFVSPENL